MLYINLLHYYKCTYNHYKNGKETATVTCDISSYYDEACPFPLVSEKQQYVVNKTVPINSVISSTNKFRISEIQPRTVNLRMETLFGIHYEFNIKAGFLEVDSGTYIPGGIVNFSSYWVIPMTFQLYDEVIPMVCGADGQERPMSKNKDGTPKIFKVLGVELSYKGVVRQKLSLQEV